MKFKRLLSILFACLLLLTVSTSCGSNRTEMLGDTVDRTERPLNANITSLKEAIPFAVARAKEWRQNAFLSSITVFFEGKEEIASRKGRIHAWFHLNNKENTPIGQAEVRICMKNNRIDYFAGGPPIPKLETGRELITDGWNIDINDAMDIAIAAFGEKELEKYENPVIGIICVTNFWDVVLSSLVKSNDGMSLERIKEVKINPHTGQIISVRNIKQLLEELKQNPNTRN